MTEHKPPVPELEGLRGERLRKAEELQELLDTLNPLEFIDMAAILGDWRGQIDKLEENGAKLKGT